MIECPDRLGIHRNVPEELYHQWDAVSASLLKTIHNNGPKQARYEQLHEKDPTPAMQFGTRAHHFLLEPERIPELYVIPLGIPKRSDVQKAQHAAFEKEIKGKDILKPEKFDEHWEMAQAMRERPDFGPMLKEAMAIEVCILWDDDETGLRMKARIDLITKYLKAICVVDYKTTSDASQWGFAKSIHTYSYHIQAAVYLDAVNSLGPSDPEPTFVLAAQEKKPVYDGMLHALGSASLETGRIQYRRALNQWKVCLDDDDFPGYPPGIGEVDMPSYAIDLTGDI